MNFKFTDMKWIKKITGIDELIKKQEETNRLLKMIEENTKNAAEAQKAYNNAYHIR